MFFSVFCFGSSSSWLSPEKKCTLHNEICVFVTQTKILRIQSDSLLRWADWPVVHKHEHQASLGLKWEDFLWLISRLLWTWMQEVFFGGHVLILFYFYEYQEGLIGLVSVVNPLHLQRLPQRDADGAALWSSAVKSEQPATLFKGVLVWMTSDVDLRHRLCVCLCYRVCYEYINTHHREFKTCTYYSVLAAIDLAFTQPFVSVL